MFQEYLLLVQKLMSRFPSGGIRGCFIHLSLGRCSWDSAAKLPAMIVVASPRFVDLLNGERDQCEEESLEFRAND
jgi:hypothetical protein